METLTNQPVSDFESGEKYKDAASYVRKYKKIVVPSSHVPEKIKSQKGKAWIGNIELVFIDKDGNIAEVNRIDYGKIASITAPAEDTQKKVEMFASELSEAGFKITTGGFRTGEELLKKVIKLTEDYQEQIQAEKKEKKEFNF